MIDAKTQALLGDLVRREGRSLLQYVGDSFPWTTAADREALDRLRRLIGEEREATAALGKFLVRRRVPVPYLGAYPDYTALNYIGLERLLPRLVAHQKDRITELERLLPEFADAESRAQAEKVLESKRRHLPLLEDLAAGRPKATVA